jgi:hypothetical protein
VAGADVHGLPWDRALLLLLRGWLPLWSGGEVVAGPAVSAPYPVRGIVDGMYVAPSLWESIDEQRQRTGGWWKNMRTVRLRLALDVLNPDYGCTIEINVQKGTIHGVRVLDLGSLHGVLRNGPHLCWELKDMLEWLDQAHNNFNGSEWQESPARLEVKAWDRGNWVGYQESVYLISAAFAENG